MIWRGVGRIFVVFIGFFLAMMAVVVLLTILGGQIFADVINQRYGDLLNDDLATIAGFLSFIVGLYPALTVLPGVLVIVIGEIGHIRSLLYYLISGGLAVVAIPLIYVAMADTSVTLPSQTLLAVFATSGFAGGLVYWLIAGRKA